MSAESFSRRTPLERTKDHLEDARESTHLIKDENARNAIYSLIWAVEALAELSEIRSVATP